jgi:hypothetical protein
MDAHITQALQLAASLLGGVLMLAAFLLLWWKSHSEWLLIALVAGGASLLFRIVFAVVPAMISSAPMLLLIWPAMGLLMAIGLLGYAIVESNRRAEPPAGKTA